MKIQIYILIFFYGAAFGQGYTYKHYTAREGLAGNNVYDAVQDNEGFMWFATETGVSRFDGTKFTNFTTSSGLPDNEILNLFVDSQNRVWMIPFKNEICYYHKGKIHTNENDPILKRISLENNPINVIEDKYGRIAILDKFSIHLISKYNNVKKINQINNQYFGLHGGGINENGEFILSLTQGKLIDFYPIYNIDINGNLIENVKNYNQEIKYFPSNKVIQMNRYGNVQINFTKAGKHQIIITSELNKFIQKIALNNLFVNTVNLSSENEIYINTKNGSHKYDIYKNVNSKIFLIEENISSTYSDTENNLWFTTLSNGIFLLPNQSVKTHFFNKSPNSNDQILSVFSGGKYIYAGGNENSCYLIDKINSNKLIKVSIEEKIIGKILKIAKYKNEIYILTEYGLYSSDTLLRNMKNVIGGLYSYKDMSISTTGQFVIASHTDVEEKFYKNGVIEKSQIIFANRATAVCDVDSGIYIGALNGLYYYNRKKAKNTFLGDSHTLLKSRITKLLYHNNRLWIGTSENGLLCFDGSKIVNQISQKNGLAGNVIRALSISKNVLWIGTNKGLNKINLLHEEFNIITTYSDLDGLANSSINDLHADGNNIYIATSSGLSYFDVTNMKTESICKLIITKLIASGQLMDIHETLITIPKAKNSLQIDFTAISFKSAGNIKYFYRLIGQDTSWKITENPSLQFLSLASGKYSLQIKARNAFGKESETKIIQISVEKSLFEKGWFQLLLFLSLVLGITQLFKYRIKQLKKKEKIKLDLTKRVAELEQLALKSQMNPHFIFNCLNSIQQYVIENDEVGANKFISNFSKLIRQTLDNSGKLEISLEEEENFLRNYLTLEKIRFEDKFNFSINIDNKINKEKTNIPPMLLQPYVENCIRHGIRLKKDNTGIIEINFSENEKYLVISILDNGVGRKIAEEYKGSQPIRYQSKGMDLTSKRIEIMNQNRDQKIEILVSDQLNDNGHLTGTCVIIKFPLNK